MSHLNKLPTTSFWVEVGLVHITGKAAANSNVIGRNCGTMPTGSKKHIAAVGTPFNYITTAEPPVSNIAVTRIFGIKPKTSCV